MNRCSSDVTALEDGTMALFEFATIPSRFMVRHRIYSVDASGGPQWVLVVEEKGLEPGQ